MMSGFESTQLDAWQQEGVILNFRRSKATRADRQKRTVDTRKSSWTVSMVGVIGAATLAISSAFAADVKSGSTLVTLLKGVPIVAPTVTDASPSLLSPIKDINRSFNTLFDSFRSGEKLLPSPRMRELAAAAIKSQSEEADIESWARRLANDIKDAND